MCLNQRMPVLISYGWCLCALIAGVTFAQERTAWDLLPASTIAYAELGNPRQLIALMKQHPLRSRIEALPEIKKALRSPDIVKLQVALGLFEGHMELPWDEALATIGDGGLYLGFDATTKSPALLVKARDLETLIKLRKAVFQLIQSAAQSSGQPDPIKKGEYRGITAYEVNDLKLAALGSWLLVTSKNELGKQIVDQYLDGGPSLGNSPRFQAAQKQPHATSTLWGFADVKAIRNSNVAQELYGGRTENIVAEVLLGGLFTNLKHTDLATADVTLSDQQLHLRLAAPHQELWNRESREYYFGNENSGRAPALLAHPQSIFAFSAYRDLSQMWLRAPDLMTDKANDELAKADSQLTTFFSGKDFGSDILAAFEPTHQLVVVRQLPETLNPQPAMKLPGFALVSQMKNPQQTQAELRRVFLSFVGFINVIGAMNGQPQFDIEMQRQNGQSVLSAQYVAEAADLDAKVARINFNFSPTMAFSQQQFVLSSTKSLALELIQSEEETKEHIDTPEKSVAGDNTLARFEFAPLAQILADNRTHLVTQNMLEKGHAEEQAEREIDTLLSLIGLLKDAQLVLNTTSDSLALDLNVRLESQVLDAD